MGEEKIVFAIDAIVYALIVKRVPQVGGRGNRWYRAKRIAFPAVGIAGVAEPFGEGTAIAAGGEAVAQHTDLAINKEVVKRDELFCQLMMDRRDGFTKDRQFWVAIASMEIAEHLIISAILFFEVQDVTNRR